MNVAAREADAAAAFIRLALAVAALTAVRMLVVWGTDLNLGPDEAQYWTWSLDPAFGYFSKPPMIAWIIAASTAACGDGEACIRSASPLLYAGTSLLVFAAALRLYGARVAFWSGLAFATLPGVSFSSALITTDVPMLFFWAAALLVLAAMLDRSPGQARALALALGASIGLAMLSKYAGAYLLLGLAAAALFDARVRAHVLSANGALILLAAALVVSPNVAWNAMNAFATVEHTAWNAGLEGRSDFVNPGRLAEFAGAQFGVFGPILMGTIVAGLAAGLRRARWPRLAANDAVLLSTSLPVVAVGLTIAFLSKANANWSAPAYVGLSIVACAWLLRADAKRLLWISTGLALLVAGLLYAMALDRRVIEAAGQTNAFKLLRGWDVQGPELAKAAEGFDAILMEDREDMASALYYARGSSAPIYMLKPGPSPTDHFQMTRAYDPSKGRRVLFVTGRSDPQDVLSRFAKHERIGESVFATARNRERRLVFFALEGPL